MARTGRIIGRLLQIIGLLTLIGLAAGAAALYYAGQWLQESDAPARADAIVCLAGDEQRLLYAADLFHQGYAPRILASRTRPFHEAPAIIALRAKLGYPVFPDSESRTRAFLAALDVPDQAVEFYGHGVVSTVEEAEALRDHLDGKQDGKQLTLLVVTSPYHAYRAGLVFREVLPGCTILALKNPHERFVERWWTDQQSAMQVVLETAKLIHYRLGGVFRSSDPAPAGQP